MKLRKAEQLRKEEFAKKSHCTDKKVSRAIERKSTQEKAVMDKLVKSLEGKLLTAEQLRQKALDSKVSVARRESEKLEHVIQKVEDMHKVMIEKLREELDKKEECACNKAKELQEQAHQKTKAYLAKV